MNVMPSKLFRYIANYPYLRVALEKQIWEQRGYDVRVQRMHGHTNRYKFFISEERVRRAK